MKPFSEAEWKPERKMTTSEQRGLTRKLPDQSRARRRLFEVEAQDQAAADNFANILQESCRIDRDNMMKKWNFDFEHEVPLEGAYEWYRQGEDSWIGMKPDPKPTALDNIFVPIEKENQMTPRAMTVDAPPAVRKRKRDSCILNEKGAKRKISFN